MSRLVRYIDGKMVRFTYFQGRVGIMGQYVDGERQTLDYNELKALEDRVRGIIESEGWPDNWSQDDADE